MTLEFSVSAVIPASPQAVYSAWLDSEGHTKMTGSPANSSANVGDSFDAWDGYITGKNLEIEPGKRIVQSWRTKDFEETHGDSQIEVTFEAVESGAKVTLHHTDVPVGHGKYEQGWVTHYFEPMTKYFAEQKEP